MVEEPEDVQSMMIWTLRTTSTGVNGFRFPQPIFTMAEVQSYPMYLQGGWRHVCFFDSVCHVVHQSTLHQCLTLWCFGIFTEIHHCFWRNGEARWVRFWLQSWVARSSVKASPPPGAPRGSKLTWTDWHLESISRWISSIGKHGKDIIVSCKNDARFLKLGFIWGTFNIEYISLMTPSAALVLPFLFEQPVRKQRVRSNSSIDTLSGCNGWSGHVLVLPRFNEKMTPKNHDSYNRERPPRVLLRQFELLLKHPTASDAKLSGLFRHVASFDVRW